MRLAARHGTLAFVMNKNLLLAIVTVAALTLTLACGSDDDDSGGGNGTDVSPTPPTGTVVDGEGDPAGEPNERSPTVSIEGPSMAVGAEGDAVLSIAAVGEPGIGAWTVDITYDTEIVSVIACDPTQANDVCNDAFTEDTIRVVGADAVGIGGTAEYARITFACNAPGESALNLAIDVIADATIGDPQILVPILEDGTITCT